MTLLRRLMVVFCVAQAGLPVHGATVWLGALTNYNQPSPNPLLAANQDRITPQDWLTRTNSKGLFNAVTETSAGNLSPADTEWAFGTVTNYSSLVFTNWLGLLNGASPVTLVGQPMVLHLISDNIYLSLQFSFWASGGSGGFTYQRSTSLPTTAGIVSPANGAVFAAPASVQLIANTAGNGGAGTNVQFLVNGISIGSTQIPPFSLTASNLAAGVYALTAVATAGGISTTSAPVNITVVTPVSPDISSPLISNNQFTFNYAANPGLTYVIEYSPNLLNWIALSTNLAASNPAAFSENMTTNAARYYRVFRAPINFGNNFAARSSYP